MGSEMCIRDSVVTLQESGDGMKHHHEGQTKCCIYKYIYIYIYYCCTGYPSPSPFPPENHQLLQKYRLFPRKVGSPQNLSLCFACFPVALPALQMLCFPMSQRLPVRIATYSQWILMIPICGFQNIIGTIGFNNISDLASTRNKYIDPPRLTFFTRNPI